MKDAFPLHAGVARRAPSFSVGPNRLHRGGGSAAEGAVLVAMPLPPKFAETARQIQESQQRYIELARQKKTISPDLHRISAAADGGGAVRLDLAGAVAFEAGQPSGGGAGCGDGGDLQGPAGLSRRYPRHRRIGGTGAVVQQHGRATRIQPSPDRGLEPRSGRGE